MTNNIKVALLTSLLSAVGLSATTTAATSSTSCNPLSTSCSADKALATTYSEDFTTNSTYFETYQSGANVHYTDEGLQLTLAERFDNPSIVSKEYILFGRVEAIVKAANGTGIISTVYLASDVGDEIDWEWFGGDASQVATDFFREANTTTYDRGTYYDMEDPRASFHNYTLDWTESAITWYVDGEVARTLSNDSSQGFPQTPCKIYIGVWAGGDASNAEGTIEWAGGSTDYSEAPFNMYVQQLIVSDYSSGSEYSYTDTSGDLSSIEAEDGEVYGRYSVGVEEFNEFADGETVSESSTETKSSSKSSSSDSASGTTSSKVSATKSLAAEEVSASGESSATTLTTSTKKSSESRTSESEDSSDSSTSSSDEATSTIASASESTGHASGTHQKAAISALITIPLMIIGLL